MMQNTNSDKDSATALHMRLFGLPSGASDNTNTNSNTKKMDGALELMIHTQIARALLNTTTTHNDNGMERARQPLQAEAYASALAQRARALSASGYAAAVAAAMGGGSRIKSRKGPRACTHTHTVLI